MVFFQIDPGIFLSLVFSQKNDGQNLPGSTRHGFFVRIQPCVESWDDLSPPPGCKLFKIFNLSKLFKFFKLGWKLNN